VNVEYLKILERAKKSSTQNKKFFERLRKQNPTNLDQTCNSFHDEVFEVIDCLKCANCCSSTGPLLLNKDIDRLAKVNGQRPGVFADKYLKIDEDGDYVFKQMPCVFLEENNYCKVYEDRPNACREFPHTQQRNILQKLKITYNNSLICPAVVLITDKLKKVYK